MTTKQLKIPLKILDDKNKLTKGESEAEFEIINDSGEEWIKIPVKITKRGNNKYNSESQNWQNSNDCWAVFTIEPFQIRFLNGITTKNSSQNFSYLNFYNYKDITVGDLELCYQNKVNHLDLNKLKEGMEIDFYLKKAWWLEEDGSYDKKGINSNFALAVRKDYKIITKQGKVLANFAKKIYFQEAQTYLENTYPNPQEVKSVNLNDKFLKGELDLNKFTNLELADLSNNQLSKIEASQCSKLKNLDLRQNNNLTELNISSLKQFERLKADSGELKKSSFFGGKSEWEPTNVGNSNVPPLKINETQKEQNILKTLILKNISVKSSDGTIEFTNFLNLRNTLKLNSREFSQVKKDIIQQIILKNPSDWFINQEFKIWKEFAEPDKSPENKVILLMHKKGINHGRNKKGEIETYCGNMHYKEAFTDEEWKQIKNVVENRVKEENEDETKNELNSPTATGNVFTNPKTYFYVVVIVVIILLIYNLVRKYLF